MIAVTRYVEQLDILLAAACSLFTVTPVTPVSRPRVDSHRRQVPPQDASALAVSVDASGSAFASASTESERSCAQLADFSTATHADARSAAASSENIRLAASNDAAAVVSTHPHEYVVLLVSAMDDRLASMQELIDQTRDGLADTAEQMRALAGDLTKAGRT